MGPRPRNTLTLQPQATVAVLGQMLSVQSGRNFASRPRMHTFDDLNELARAHSIELLTQPLADGQIGVMVTMAHEPSPIRGMACAVASPEDLDQAARALIPAIEAALSDGQATTTAAAATSTEGELFAACCAACGAPVLYAASGGQTGAAVTCPACTSSERRVERLSVALALMIVQSTVTEIAGRAATRTADELVPVLAELERLTSALSPSGDD